MTQPAFDLVLRNARIIDPSQRMATTGDVGIRGGRIASAGPKLSPASAPIEKDLGGRYLCPGLIDLHGHWYGGSAYGIDPNMCLNHGVTTAVDAGTTGFINFADFHNNQIQRSRVRVLAFLNISAIGIPTQFVGELEDIRYARANEAADVVRTHSDAIVGIKIRQGVMTGVYGMRTLQPAIDAAQSSGVPMMVHIGKNAATPEILSKLRPGDIVTHCFQGRGDGILNGGNLIPEAIEARRAGIIFDIGHGAGSFEWNTAKKAFEHHFYPDTISTDLHRYSVERWAIDMTTTMSKFLHLGMPLEDVIAKTTCVPAKVIGKDEQLGTLKTGTPADIFVFEVEDGDFALEDTHLHVEHASKRVRPFLTVKGGELIEPGSYPVALRKFHACDHDVLKFIEETA